MHVCADWYLLFGQKVQTFTYDLFGREISGSTPNTFGNQTTSTTDYDDLGRITTTISGEGIQRDFRYDAGDRPLKITESGNTLSRVTDFVYNAVGDLVEERFPDVDDTKECTSAYDALGRRSSISGDQTEKFSYTYDALDQVLTSTDGRNN